MACSMIRANLYKVLNTNYLSIFHLIQLPAIVWDHATVDIDSTKVDTMATIKVVNSDDVPQSASLFTSQISSSNLDFTLNGLKLHLVQNLIKKAKIPLPLPLLCPHHTFLVSLIFASKFLQNWCYSNKVWVKLSRLPPCKISCCEHNCFVYHSLHILPQTQSLWLNLLWPQIWSHT